MQEIRRQIRDGLGMGRNERILLGQRSRAQLVVLLRQRIHLLLQLRLLLHQPDTGVPGVDDLVVRVLYLRPLVGVVVLKGGDKLLRFGREGQLGMGGSQDQDVGLHLAELRRLTGERIVGDDEHDGVDGDQRQRNHRPAPRRHVLMPDRYQHCVRSSVRCAKIPFSLGESYCRGQMTSGAEPK